ncbi:flagellar basal-body rod protein FlgG [Donghicola tyrosinivorans]|uniref:Flagellar basal-body rod protein FlgG n=1 Tax=Donghicola tyrosinivorans TaxID=1652492 RepID=A0A2T0WIY4_9RHOB|nr:flagellar basal-body rod protein FlgG [Donghicola tyrosinivorans]MEC9199797.1 flagellar basal-body rod protein FlgG [Pseudomonadota bacterium]MEE3070762.1 flagellar basal-body rod protein FlgG [Pseudomonadota bacterium]PRY86494.1 flagellar basal-body rod protein FlgG [Donghicola tyrosinivorans]
MSSAAMHVAKTGLNAQQARIQVISNNLANVNTTGFKRDRANFETLLYQTWKSGGAQTSEATQLTSASAIGTGVRMVNTQKLYSQGNLQDTGNNLDIAINGQGFFQVLMPNGEIGYTRNGTFSRNAEGTLTTSSGYVVQPEIQIPADAMEINISDDGIVSITTPGNQEYQEVGQIQLATFSNPRGLNPVGESFVTETPASGAPIIANPMQDGMGKINQGSLEASNVNVVQELVDMIEAQRAYELNSKSISASDEMMQFLSNKV